MSSNDVFDALAAEHAAIDSMLSGLPAGSWSSASACPGWTVADVVIHLAQTEAAVVASIEERPMAFGGAATAEASGIDELVEAWVDSERGLAPDELLPRWRDAAKASVEGLRAADPERALLWAAAPL